MNTKLTLSIAFFLGTLSHYAVAESTDTFPKEATACAGCHGKNGIGLSYEFPNLAGQKKEYLIKQINAFKNGDRKDPTMNVMAATLTDKDIKTITSYYSSLSNTPDVVVQKASKTDKITRTEFPEDVFITMKKSAQVEAFPAEKFWQGNPNMLYNAVTPDGKMVLATSPSDNTVTVFDSNSGKQLAVIPVGKAPKGVKVSPDGKQAYVSNQGSAEVSVIDLASLTVVTSIATEKGPHNARFTQDGKIAYITLQGGAGIGVIDTKQQKMIKVIPVPGITGPHNLDLSHDEKTAFVRDFVHHVAVLDLVSGKVKKVITVGNGHGGIDVSPNGEFVATAAIGDDYISVIDTKTLKQTDIKVGNGPHGIRTSKNNKWIYVTITKENSVVVINADTMKVEKKIAVGKFPFWVAVNGNP